jgi:nitrogen regulatory protein PII-like uncharacterized protein
MAKKGNKKDYPQNIAPELFEAWKLATRQGDTMKLAKKLGVSRPTIERAILYGSVVKEDLIEGISQFFEDRIEEEKQKALRIVKKLSGIGADDRPE